MHKNIWETCRCMFVNLVHNNARFNLKQQTHLDTSTCQQMKWRLWHKSISLVIPYWNSCIFHKLITKSVHVSEHTEEILKLSAIVYVFLRDDVKHYAIGWAYSFYGCRKFTVINHNSFVIRSPYGEREFSMWLKRSVK